MFESIVFEIHECGHTGKTKYEILRQIHYVNRFALWRATPYKTSLGDIINYDKNCQVIVNGKEITSIQGRWKL
jgi:hypothetical protein